MERVIIEVFPPNGPPIAQRHVLEANPIRVGRAYDNDLIPSDRFISPHHLLIRPVEDGEDSGTWVVHDLGSRNGFRFDDAVVRGGAARLRSGDELIVGKTRLCLFSPRHGVPQARRLMGPGVVSSRLRRPAWVWTLAIGAVVLAVSQTHLGSWSADPGSDLAFAALGAAFTMLFWALGWGFLGRVLKHRWDFSAHLAVAALTALGFILLHEIRGYVTFVVGSTGLDFVTRVLVNGVVFGAAFGGSLKLATTMPGILRRFATGAVSVGLVGLLAFLAYEDPDESLRPRYSHELKPIPASLLSSRTIDEFLETQETVFE